MLYEPGRVVVGRSEVFCQRNQHMAMMIVDAVRSALGGIRARQPLAAGTLSRYHTVTLYGDGIWRRVSFERWKGYLSSPAPALCWRWVMDWSTGTASQESGGPDPELLHSTSALITEDPTVLTDRKDRSAYNRIRSLDEQLDDLISPHDPRRRRRSLLEGALRAAGKRLVVVGSNLPPERQRWRIVEADYSDHQPAVATAAPTVSDAPILSIQSALG